MRSLRIDLRKSQQRVADESGVKWAKEICLFESGKKVPRADQLPEIAKALECEIEDLYEEGGNTDATA